MTAILGDDPAAQALRALSESCQSRTSRGLWPEEHIRSALAAGASLEQVAATLGADADEIWEHLTRSLRNALRKNAIANADLSETEALDLAVAETKATRSERARCRISAHLT